ncbi:MAG: SRPBCC family protein [Kofleriaceae bacterium]
MEPVVQTIAADVGDCWRAFVDPKQMTRWVSGLVAARTLVTNEHGLPTEIEFEFGKGLRYSLKYKYEMGDPIAVRWEPREAAKGGVRGWATFEELDAGTKLTYALEHDVGRKAAERMMDAPKINVAAFARYMEET